MKLILLAGVILSALFVGCFSPESPPSPAKFEPPHAPANAGKEWPGVAYAKVVAYRYLQHGEMLGEDAGCDPFVLQMGQAERLNLQLLHRRKTGEKVLTPEQVQCVIDGCYRKTSSPDLVAGCMFEPHHIFVFYSAKGDPVAYAEVCFKCGGGHAYPDAAGYYDWNFGILAGVLDEIGLLRPAKRR